MSRRKLRGLIKRLRGAYYTLRINTGGYSNLYDRAFYLQQYPDIAAASIGPDEHFYRFGRSEGRIGRLPELKFIGTPEADFDSTRETVLVVSHEASRTGAPILSLNLVRILGKRYNVVALLLGGGPLVEAFRDAGAVVLGPYELRHNPVMAGLVMNQLLDRCQIKFALVNSIESRVVLPSLAQRFVPRISLLHEFAAYTRPRHAFREALFWSSDSVFSARLTLQSALDEYPDLGEGVAHILPQGRCLLPEQAVKGSSERQEKLLKALRPASASSDTFLIVGVGFVQLRKGVDLFIECASRVMRAHPERNIRFAWIGRGYDPDHDVSYSVYLADQIKRAGLERHIVFLDETPEIDVVYQQADVLLLTSRLDPLPNVAIDALSEGLPVVCFENTTGIADILAEEGLQESCVAGYLDSCDMASKLLRLANDRDLYQEVVARSRTIAAKRFDMADYVAKLERLAIAISGKARQESEDVATIASSKLVRQDFFCLPHFRNQPEDEAILGYVRAWACGMGQRKPFPGFHPGIYQELNGLDPSGPDPLADYLRKGKPEGPWISQVITSEPPAPQLLPGPRVALHLHVYYPKLLGEMLKRLKHNLLLPDLFVSVPNDQVKAKVAQELGSYPGKVIELVTVPNRGRDIGPLLTAFGPALSEGYDFVGHLHTKMSADVKDRSMGETWYHFLLENLLGGKAGAMADRIIAHMQADPTIGLVFPDDPNAVGWSANRPFAEDLATRLHIAALPEHILFPVGTMFWARSEALRPILELDLQWQDYPEEPLPYDGSMLHALERLFPLSIADKAMRCAVTNISGMTR